MSERVMRAVTLIEAHDKASAKFEKFGKAVGEIERKMKLVESASTKLNATMVKGGDVASLAKARENLARIGAEFREAQDKAKRFGEALKGGRGTHSMSVQYERAQEAVRRLAGAYEEARASARRAMTDFRAAKVAAKPTVAGGAHVVATATQRPPVVLPPHVQRRMSYTKTH